jgi:hypothetical protein
MAFDGHLAWLSSPCGELVLTIGSTAYNLVGCQLGHNRDDIWLYRMGWPSHSIPHGLISCKSLLLTSAHKMVPRCRRKTHPCGPGISATSR